MLFVHDQVGSDSDGSYSAVATMIAVTLLLTAVLVVYTSPTVTVLQNLYHLLSLALCGQFSLLSQHCSHTGKSPQSDSSGLD